MNSVQGKKDNKSKWKLKMQKTLSKQKKIISKQINN